MKDQLRLAILLSGKGTTAQAIIRASKNGRIPVHIACVIASQPDAEGIQKALKEGIAPENVLVISQRDFESSEAFGKAIIRACNKRGVDVIGQYGWMPKTPLNVIEAFPSKMINQHPGPLDPGRPDFGGKNMYGKRVHCARILFVREVKRDFWTEATAQWVHQKYDIGKVIGRQRVPIFKGDDVDALSQRVLPVEYEVQIEALRALAQGQIKELVREQPLLLPGEEDILARAKRDAVLLFPNG